MADRDEGRRLSLGLWAIAALTILCFGSLLQADFVDWDDRDVILHNQALRDFDWVGIFSQFVVSNYQPVTVLSFAVEHALMGARAPLYHATNVLLHTLNCVLLPLLLARLFPVLSRWVLLGVGFLFAVHPLHVESVAWVTERKDVLSVLFLLLAFRCYDNWLRSKASRHYAYMTGAFVLALLSKPMAVTFPLLLLVLDFARGRRLTLDGAWLEKLPLFVLSLVVGIVALSAQQVVSAVTETDFGPWMAVQNGVESLAFYLSRSFWPSKLVVYYEAGLFELGWAAYAASLAVVGLLFWPLHNRGKEWRRGPYAFGLGFFFLSILPVLKAVPFGNDSLVNDRFMYLPSVGLFLALLLLAERVKFPHAMLRTALSTAVILLLAALSAHQTRVWRNGESLWLNVLEHYPESFKAHDSLGLYYTHRGQSERGASYLEKALALRPGEVITLKNLAESYGRAGDHRRSIETYQRALKLSSRDASTHNNLGWQLYQVDDWQQAERLFRKALALEPTLAISHRNLGYLYAERGRLELAEKHYVLSLKQSPYQAETNEEFAQLLEHLGRSEEAKRYFQNARRLRGQAR